VLPNYAHGNNEKSFSGFWFVDKWIESGLQDKHSNTTFIKMLKEELTLCNRNQKFPRHHKFSKRTYFSIEARNLLTMTTFTKYKEVIKVSF